jgi:hypothetical protein
MQNYQNWLKTCMDPTFEKIAAFTGQGEDLALLELAQGAGNKVDAVDKGVS